MTEHRASGEIHGGQDIDQMLEESDSRETRSILRVCQSLTRTLERVVEELNAHQQTHKRRFDDHENKLEVQRLLLEDHAKLAIQAKTLLAGIQRVLSITFALFIAFAGYGGMSLVSQRDTLTKYSTKIPRMEVDIRDLQVQVQDHLQASKGDRQ